MAECSIDIAFEGGRRRFEPGDKIAGTVRVTPRSECTCQELIIHRQWVVSTDTEVYRGGDDDIVLYEGPWHAGRVEEYPFIFHAPPGPYDYQGELLEIDWTLCAQTRLEGREDVRKEARFDIEPSGEEIDFVFGEPTTHDETGEDASSTELALEGLGAAILLVLGLWLVYPSVAATSGATLWTLLGGVGSLGAGAWLLNRILRRRRRDGEDAYGGAEVTDYHVAPGDHVSFVVDLQPNFRTTPRGITALLKGYERVCAPAAESAGAELHRFYEEPISITATSSEALEHGRAGSFRVDFRVPDDAPYSFRCPVAQVGWAIEVHVDVGSWPDWSRDFPLVVRPSIAAPASHAPPRRAHPD